MSPPQEMIDRAINIARDGPCAKSKRGVAIWQGRQWAIGANQPSMGGCDGSEACRAACPRICIHAEQQAILAALQSFALAGAELLHVKVVDGVLVPSGPPSCVECSKLILRTGIDKVWLFHETGWRAYSPNRFHQQTLQTLGLPYFPSVP